MTGHFNIFNPLAAIELFKAVKSLYERASERPWVAALELILIGSVVYAVLRFLQGTRGARLVRAVLMILAVGFAFTRLVAEQLELERINVLYPYFIFGVFLISLVAFQVELRRILFKLGEGGWLRRWSKSPERMIDSIVIAVERLSKRKIGALIAIERATELGAITETGIRLDAHLSAELLETIFWPGTALHDLGVVIRKSTITAAGCQFPLVESGEVDRSLGSRHRAAVGISHEVDAVILIVSEETGAISVAIGGRLHRGLTPSRLRVMLMEALWHKSASEPTTNEAADENPTSRITQDGTSQVA